MNEHWSPWQPTATPTDLVLSAANGVVPDELKAVLCPPVVDDLPFCGLPLQPHFSHSSHALHSFWRDSAQKWIDVLVIIKAGRTNQLSRQRTGWGRSLEVQL